MLGLLLIYFLGKKFYDLAFDHKRSPWLYAILGVVTYYGGLYLLGITIEVIMISSNNYSYLSINETLRTIFYIPLGLLCAFALYKVLEKNWCGKPIKKQTEELLDDF